MHVNLEQAEQVIEAAVAVEMIHAATMAHDDVVDSATMRRGRDSVNEVWTGQIAVLMGDFLLARALCMLVELGNLSAHTLNVCHILRAHIFPDRVISLGSVSLFQAALTKMSRELLRRGSPWWTSRFSPRSPPHVAMLV